MNIHITRVTAWMQCRRRGQLSNLYSPKYEPEWARTGSNVHAYLAYLTDPKGTVCPEIDTYSTQIGEHYFMWLNDHTSYSGKALNTSKWIYKNEVPFTIPWLNTPHYMQGHIDSIVFDGTTKEHYVLEYKTTTNIITRAEQILYELQPIWYVLAAQQMGYNITKIVYHLIRKKIPGVRSNADTTKYWQELHNHSGGGNTEQNYFAQIIVPIDRYDLEVWQTQLEQIINEYTECQHYYPVFGYHCKWCHFSTVCGLMQRKDTQDLAESLLSQDFNERSKE